MLWQAFQISEQNQSLLNCENIAQDHPAFLLLIAWITEGMSTQGLAGSYELTLSMLQADWMKAAWEWESV